MQKQKKIETEEKERHLKCRKKLKLIIEETKKKIRLKMEETQLSKDENRKQVKKDER